MDKNSSRKICRKILKKIFFYQRLKFTALIKNILYFDVIIKHKKLSLLYLYLGVTKQKADKSQDLSAFEIICGR